MRNSDLEIISTALQAASVDDFNGHFTSLGGGEINNTYSIDVGEQKLILRIAKDNGQQTLKNEAHALQLLKSQSIPELIFFDEDNKINNRLWILESYIPGHVIPRLSVKQFESLGYLLADIHKQATSTEKLELQKQLLNSCKPFGDKEFLISHPDIRLSGLIRGLLNDFETKQPIYDKVVPVLIHADATPSNVRVNGDAVALIDWEFSGYSDPMRDFSTIYYEDIEYNQGKWRIKITDEEKRSLFNGYRSAGGIIDEERIQFWIRFDKLTAAIFLYWRINQSARTTDQAEMDQYKLDYENLVTSLSR